jgi:putative transcriptional regulator
MTCARSALVLLATALLTIAANPASATEPGVEPAAGELLIASAAIQDPRFHHSVILVLRHDEKGAFGIVINHPLTERPIAGLLAESGGQTDQDAQGRAIEGTIRVFLGGPVEPSYGFVIHSGEYRRPETLTLDIGVAMTATKDILRDIGRHQGPAKYLLALGYAGWGAGQLEGEIARHDWFTTPGEPDLVFDEERGQLWERALARRTREL